MEEFYIKTIVGGAQSENRQITVYLFNKSKSLAIPLALEKTTTDALLLAQQQTDQQRPQVYDTIQRLINNLGGKVVNVYVYMEKNGVFYSYMRVFANGRSVDVDIKFSDALCTAVRTKCPIIFEESVLKTIALSIE